MDPLIRDFLEKNPAYRDSQDRSGIVLALLDFIAPKRVVIGGIYKHFKGNRYKVLGLVRTSSDFEGELHVKYVQMNDADHEVTRPLSEFLEVVKRDDYTGPRFTYTGSA